MKRPPGKDMRDRARRLRRESTPAEQLLWKHLRARRLDGFKFRQQMWLCGFIADFACVEAKLVIEADGGQHGSNEAYDRQRSAAFAKEGFSTLRFWNNEILENIDGVLLTIREALPSPSQPGGAGRALPSAGRPVPRTGRGG